MAALCVECGQSVEADDVVVRLSPGHAICLRCQMRLGESKQLPPPWLLREVSKVVNDLPDGN